MPITIKGQVNIPLAIRESLGLLPNTEVNFIREGNQVYLQKVKKNSKRSKNVVEKLRATATVKMTTDEIMALTRGEK